MDTPQAREWSVRTEKSRHDSTTRRALLTAARAVVSDCGYARMTVSDITTAAGVSRATFYVYFSSKKDVFSVLAHDVRDRFLAAQDLTDLDDSDTGAVAAATVGAYLDAYVDNLAFLTVLEHQALADADMRALYAETQDRSLRRTARYIERLVTAGRADPAASPEAIARATGGMVAAYADVVLADPGQRDDVVTAVTAMYLRLLGIPHHHHDHSEESTP
ncbi:TetR/AcrR family transcriptional regulator [Corynebacterium sp. USCH3]|uniref:TetR/AcrR family transcriptional regulator n=1 Tax=Corynebacterium sp. USCH3 TaxID=3024840 RepID=UPI0030A9CDD3